MRKRIETDLEEGAVTQTVPRNSRPCRVCKCVKASSELDSTGRCFSCADVKAATDAGMTYGKWRAQQYEAQMERSGAQERLERRIRESQKKKNSVCLNCFGIIPEGGAYEQFCCRECRAKWEQRQKDAEARGAFRAAPPKKPVKPPRQCPYCGKPVEGKKKYCNDSCKYLFNQDKVKQRAKRAADQKREQEGTRPNLICRRCGKQIIAPTRSAYCSESCAREAHILQKRGRRRQAGKE